MGLDVNNGNKEKRRVWQFVGNLKEKGEELRFP
jgi:hypothetical protein